MQVLLLAREMGMLKLGTVALDGTKIHASASKHSALSYEHAGKIEAQLKAEVAELMAKAEAADKAEPFPMACRSRTNWPGARSGCKSWLRPARRSKLAPRSASSGSRLSIVPSLQRARPRRRPRAESPAASRQRRQLRGRGQPIRSI